jgi:CubicO group peptidase (beta-lactamase class C family)
MPTRREILIASAALATGGFACAQPASGPARRALGEIQDELRALIPDLLRRYRLPGLSLALVREREIVWAEAFGLRDKEANAPLTPDTLFESASLTKPAYAYAVLKLAEQGRFDLRRSLTEYLGRNYNPGDPRLARVNAWHVLTHTSGIAPVPEAGKPTQMDFAPGERFRYSPHAFDHLQKAVERAIGEPIEPMMQRMLLQPFGMKQSAFRWSEDFVQSGARGYDDTGKRGQTFNERVWRFTPEEWAKFFAPYPFEVYPNAAAGLHCTPSDYARFLIEVMRPGRSQFHLGPDMMGQMMTPQVRVGEFKALHWGLGFGLQRPAAGPHSFWHWGDWGIFQHYAVAYRDEGAALVVMTNSTGLLACQEVAVRALGYEQPSFAWLTSD